MKVHAGTVTVLLLFNLLLAASPCFAHKVRIFAWGEGNTIHTESMFSGGKAAQNATVMVIDITTGAELLQGTTDENGLFTFPAPGTDTPELNIVVDSGDGHKNSWRYQPEPSPGERTSPSTQNNISEVVAAPSPSAGLTEEQFTSLMEGLLEAKLAPIRRQLAEQQEKSTSIQDILGGLGYILGLAGIAAYITFKKKQGER